MTIVGVLDADLRGGAEYRMGGIGPFFAQTRVEERFALGEFLGRALRACQTGGVTKVVSIFVDDREVFRAGEDAEDTPERALKLARDETAGEDGVSFLLMLTHQDGDLTHVITVEATVDHPTDEPAITVLDTAWAADDEEEEEDEPSGWEPDDYAEDDLEDGAEDESEEESRAKEVVQALLERLLDTLDRELSLSEPEIDVWIDREGQYNFNRLYAEALPEPGAALD